MRLRPLLGLVACALLLSLAGCASGAPTKSLLRNGGARITLHVACLPDQANCDVNAQLSSAVGVLSRRASAAGYHDVAVLKGGDAQTIIVEAPGVADGQQLVPLLTSRGQIFFIDSGRQDLAVGDDVSDNICQSRCKPGQYAVLFRGEDIDPNQVSAGLDPNTQQPVVTFAFKGDAKLRFANYTAQNIGKFLTITLDNKVIESATIQSQITGPGQISGNMTVAQAKTLAAQLASGALPLMLTLVSVDQILPAATK
jgi:preprotein translocase subunit SecD